jgi:hypothetical protein
VQITLTGIATGVTTVSLALWLAYRWQQRVLSRLVNGLTLHSNDTDVRHVNLNHLGDVPASVARYLCLVLGQDQPLIRLAHFEQVGTLRTGVTTERWMSFEASHTVAPAAIGFLWNARVSVAPLLYLRVRDALLSGHGSGQVSVFSLVTVASARDRLELNSGALHRFLAEAVWYPTALLPSSKLRWRAINDRTAGATLTDHGIAVSLDFRFNSAGEVESIYTPARWGTFAGGYKQIAWEGHFSRYARRNGLLVPSQGEVGWYSEGEWRSVWQGTLVSAAYELA